MVLDGIGWYWMVLDGIGWYWMVLGCFRLPQNGIEHSELYVGGWDGIGMGMDLRVVVGIEHLTVLITDFLVEELKIANTLVFEVF